MAVVNIFPCGPLLTNTLLLICEETKQAAIIDPAQDCSSKIINEIETQQLQVNKILLTHSHLDHIAEVVPLKEKYSVDVWVHPNDALNLEKPGSDGIPLFMPVKGVKADHDLEEDQIISVGNLKLRVIHTPGHSPGGVCFYIKEKNILISGDTLFKSSIGNLSFASASPEDMWESLKKLSVLPPETKVYPGHGFTTMIGDEPWLSDAKKYFGS